MATIDKSVLARIEKNGKHFEIVVDPELAAKARDELKKGKNVDISSVLSVLDIFEDSKKGIRAPRKILQAVFETDDILTVAGIILKDGDMQVTQQQRTKEHQEKWDKIIALISMNAIDGRTKKPIPRKTIEDAMQQGKIHVDDKKKVEDQLQDVIKKLKVLIPISFESKTMELQGIAANIAGRCLEISKKMGEVTKQTWNSDGSLSFTINVPAGLREEYMNKVNDITRGKTNIKLLD